MDAFGFHPYPNSATDPLDRGYSWPNAGFVNLDRMKQALWDAFHGTPQPTTVEGLKLNLDEVGWQVGTRGLVGYTGAENVPVTDELTQSQIYAELVQRAQCDPDVAQVSFFGFRDDGSRLGFQAGLDRLDGSPRPAAEAVATAIAATAGGCTGGESHWAPGAQVVGTSVRVDARTPTLTVTIGAGEDAWVRVCAARPGELTAASGIASLPRSACRRTLVPGLHQLEVALPAPAGLRRRVEIRVDLHAQANQKRRTHVLKEARLHR
jgi:hypothetical protein